MNFAISLSTKIVQSCLLPFILSIVSTIGRAQVVPSNFPLEIAHGEPQIEPGITTPTLVLSFPFSPGSFELSVQRSERQSSLHEWVTRRRRESTPYIMTAISARRGGEVLYVAGMKADGKSIVERWEYNYPDGRHAPTFLDPNPALPIALASPFRPTTAIRGGVWKPLRGIPAPQKTVIYEGTEGPFTVIEADPESRFLLLYDYTQKSLRRVLTSTPGILETLYTAQDHPQLTELGSMEARDRASGERVIVLWKIMPRNRSLADEVFTLLTDTDNDTTFDAIEAFPYADYKLSQYWSPGDWIFLWQGS